MALKELFRNGKGREGHLLLDHQPMRIGIVEQNEIVLAQLDLIAMVRDQRLTVALKQQRVAHAAVHPCNVLDGALHDYWTGGDLRDPHRTDLSEDGLRLEVVAGQDIHAEIETLVAE